MPDLGCLLPAVLFLKFSGISLTKSVYFLTGFSVLFLAFFCVLSRAYSCI